MTKHISGPWDVFTDGPAYAVGPSRFCTVARFYPSESERDTILANARLIAAAPDLLAACKGAMRILALWGGNDCPEDDHLFEENRSLFMMQQAFIEAIAKAEGGK